MKNISFVLMLTAITLFAACNKKASPAKVVLTNFNTDILPLVQAKCTPCHLPSKGGNKANFETYESAKKFGPEMLDRVMIAPGQRGFMPRNHDKLTDPEIALIKKWIDQGLQEK